MLKSKMKILILVFSLAIILFMNCRRDMKHYNPRDETTSNIDASEIVSPKTNIQFERLTGIEVLGYETEDNHDNRYIRIYAIGETKREIAKFPILYSKNDELIFQLNKKRNRIVFIGHSQSPNIDELWYLNGEIGIVKKIFETTSSYDFKIDDAGETICLYDGLESNVIPILHIYDLDTLIEINKVQYEPYRNKGMYPVKMENSGNAFIVKLSADTVDFATLEIPKNGTGEYHVVESYSWEKDQDNNYP
ncbi:hypothetical protein AGMMS50293_19970 [Spirochaetia bacterium]|nr:hypothetical protein AGMMS50293_19970 [Spirochaetia bacterium]